MDFRKFLILGNTSIKEAMKRLEETEQKILFVVDDTDKLRGTLTDGDIRRWILSEGGLQESVRRICHEDPFVVSPEYSLDHVKQIMLGEKIGCVPVVDEGGKIQDVLFWEFVFGDGTGQRVKRQINLPVVIMAGGKGTRLDPFTKILPKPLVPIGDKTILELIIEKFAAFGATTFFLTVNYKSRIIKSYFDELNPPYRIEYVQEEQPLGTAGGLRLLRQSISTPLLVTNCDILIDADYAEIVDWHNRNRNDITLVASLKHFNIPYGVCEITNGGGLSKITEKPEYSFLVNTGMYVLQPEMLERIPPGEMYHITQLLDAVRGEGGRVGVFPIGESQWLDTGEWAEYEKTVRRFQAMVSP